MKMIRTLFFFLLFCVHQVLILPQLLIYSLWARFRGLAAPRMPVSWVTHTWGCVTCWLGGARIHCEDRSGIPPGETFLVVSNHQGDFDIPLLLACLPRPLAFVAKKELANVPLVSCWMRLCGCVFLDREDRRRQVEQVKEIVEKLQSGLSMVVFPEGTRSRSAEMRPFAKGSLSIAYRAGLRILPVTLCDTWKLLPRGERGLPGGHVKVILHPPVDPAALTPEERNHIHERVQGIIASGLTEGT
jgi:1-acyl-sn-glycerol-3-phosphate acyltransferase